VDTSKDRGQATVLAVAALMVALTLVRTLVEGGLVVAAQAAAQAAADTAAPAAVHDDRHAGSVAAANDARVVALRRVPGRVQVTVVRNGREATATAELTPDGP
jgi:hypothetical protein